MLRFVLLEHHWNGLHWDLMIEREPGGRLRTWAIDAEVVPGVELPARVLLDHRRHYLDYEGPISDGRGDVRRLDEGTCEIHAESDEGLLFHFAGRYLTGPASLRVTSGAIGGASWVFRFGNSR